MVFKPLFFTVVYCCCEMLPQNNFKDRTYNRKKGSWCFVLWSAWSFTPWSLHLSPLQFLPIISFFFLFYLASFLWWSKASWHAQCNWVSSGITSSCTDLVKELLPNHTIVEQNRVGEWAGHWSMPVIFLFSTIPPPTIGWCGFDELGVPP